MTWVLIYILSSRPVTIQYAEQYVSEPACRQVEMQKKKTISKFDNRDFICAPLIKRVG